MPQRLPGHLSKPMERNSIDSPCLAGFGKPYSFEVGFFTLSMCCYVFIRVQLSLLLAAKPVSVQRLIHHTVSFLIDKIYSMPRMKMSQFLAFLCVLFHANLAFLCVL